ncbi:DUF805 domain-containing protein [Paenarthrobacter histidinolovorans]|uniref:Uncharacterized membrane protein YhaH (DUF805 family) n=1 Tax=Paenarthrobacter histidinolovorans TaxID=43664 RepID=A0ABW8N9Y4_9MICC|nr:DUF805 domain-containing protein [Paenarthrobacter histidinolovorans]GGJ40975.1 hypothetical protein GCM10010052_42620 [Paenarthrobacter histidinolovorans]
MSYPQQPQQTQPYAAQAGEPPLWAPYYGAPIGAAVKRFFKKYTAFSGRASRSEYWWWTLVNAIVLIVLNILMTSGLSIDSAGTPVLGPVYVVGLVLAVVWGLATLVPSIALIVRRLHDANLSGWLALLVVIPVVAIVFALLPSNPAGQRFDQPTA